MNQESSTTAMKEAHPWAAILIALANGENIGCKLTADEDTPAAWRPLDPYGGKLDALVFGHTEVFEFRVVPRTIKVNGITVPAPLTQPLLPGQAYWVPAPGRTELNEEHLWIGASTNESHLARGIAHGTPKGAAAHAAAWTGQELAA